MNPKTHRIIHDAYRQQHERQHVCLLCVAYQVYSTTERSPHTAVLLVAIVTLLCFFLGYSERKAQSTATLSVNIMNTAS